MDRERTIVLLVLIALGSIPILRSELSLGPEALKARVKAEKNLVEGAKANAKARIEGALELNLILESRRGEPRPQARKTKNLARTTS